MTKTKPIIFSMESVFAIKAGKKTQTRRLLKLKHLPTSEIASIHKDGSGKGWIAWSPKPVSAEETIKLYPGEQGFKPRYQVNDILWIKENYYQYGHWKKNGKLKTGTQRWKFIPFEDKICYTNEVDIAYLSFDPKKRSSKIGMYKRWAMFMPKKYARHWIKITDVRAEQLQSISQEDAKAEGVLHPAPHRCPGWTDPLKAHRDCYICVFKLIWNQINGPKGNHWDINPWVWVYTFELTTKP
jgi:hypothetical protein